MGVGEGEREHLYSLVNKWASNLFTPDDQWAWCVELAEDWARRSRKVQVQGTFALQL